MRHLTPEQFVDLAEGTTLESSLPHLAACDACKRELADLRAMMAEASRDEVANVPEPSPLFWHHLSSRVREAVAGESPRGRWFAWPRVLMPTLAGVLAVVLAIVFLPREAAVPGQTPIPSTPLPVADNATLPTVAPLAPFGAADDPQLRIVAAAASSAAWDEMMDEVAAGTAGTADAVASVLTADEQRELQRLLAQEIAQPSALEKRS